MANESSYKKTLKYLIILMVSSIIVVDLFIILIPDKYFQHAIAIISLNIAGATATGLGVIAVIRYGISGSHGKSYLFLTIGIALWFAADLGIMYSYFALHVDEFKQITLLDILWLGGYLFLIFHLISIIRTIRIRNMSITLTIISAVIIGFVIVNLVSFLLLSESTLNNGESNAVEKGYGLSDLAVTILYPILDLCLIVPSITILLNVYREYHHSIPWVLASVSLLVNAIADNGYTNDYIHGSASALPWDLFYIADFIIMSGALFWYNRYHITDHISKKNKRNEFIN
ncbi:MAG TPA: hypothetical protein VJL78_05905 [Candidatus Nitrosocosmicus sp.]|nr:hypothetical protein [Candidatus Nitrosocosmicus sp.]